METAIVNLETIYSKLEKIFRTKKAVKVVCFDHKVKVIHYQTTIFEVNQDGEITLDNGGYMTRTTKDHLNECLEALGKVERIYQKKGKWYVSGLDTTEFTRGFKMTTY
ncbi:hypothetical protein [Hymenobacter cavernae]|uniref:Uncharacterized protein n=1 Tax=Hymenobacter cavernae TaxID=2044852 RepID=A0ABQ1UVN9_9BACT|nr:hypothetical protein [Hymenobacter cavernae]GGF26406.1 hypothetical protein GCM10011383_42410 [Hymenobacter cavernae]